MNSATLQLAAAVASLTLVRVLDIEGLLGLGPAITLGSGALAALPAGLLMDRFGRVPVLAGGFARGRGRLRARRAGQRAGVGAGVLVGLVLVGASSSTALLARTAAGDMYPAERRARGIALVLFGSVFGAILGPAVFGPLLSGRELDGDALSTLWLAGGGFMLAGLAIVLTVRPDPKRIAELLARRDADEHDRCEAGAPPAAPLRELHPAPGRDPGAARRAGELRRHGRGDDADRRGRRRPSPSRGEQRLSRSSART